MRYLGRDRRRARQPGGDPSRGAVRRVPLGGPRAGAPRRFGRIADRPVRRRRRLPRQPAGARRPRRRRRRAPPRRPVLLARLRRLDSDRGTVLRRGRRARLDRKERLPDRSRARVVPPPRRDRHRPRPAAGRAARGAVRLVRAVPRRLPDVGVPRSRRPRRAALPRLLDDRAPGAAARVDRGASRRARLRMRRLPGRLPLESPAVGPRLGRRPDAAGVALDGPGRVAAEIRGDRVEPRGLARAPEERRGLASPGGDR